MPGLTAALQHKEARSFTVKKLAGCCKTVVCRWYYIHFIGRKGKLGF